MFVDDVREEVGGKFSLMGVLGPEIWVNEPQIHLVCVFIYWAADQEVSVSGEFEIHNALEGSRPPPPFQREMQKHKEDVADRWMIQMVGRVALRLGDEPLTLKARFKVGEAIYSNGIVIERGRPGENQTRVVGADNAED
ncbi:MAG TPA: hypothetical protein VEZ48_06805 [Sphingomonadaceae bacterium]|nr:hypothetical protein [Sphingomonadaceae bacterium]